MVRHLKLGILNFFLNFRNALLPPLVPARRVCLLSGVGTSHPSFSPKAAILRISDTFDICLDRSKTSYSLDIFPCQGSPSWWTIWRYKVSYFQLYCVESSAGTEFTWTKSKIILPCPFQSFDKMLAE